MKKEGPREGVTFFFPFLYTKRTSVWSNAQAPSSDRLNSHNNRIFFKQILNLFSCEMNEWKFPQLNTLGALPDGMAGSCIFSSPLNWVTCWFFFSTRTHTISRFFYLKSVAAIEAHSLTRTRKKKGGTDFENEEAKNGAVIGFCSRGYPMRSSYWFSPLFFSVQCSSSRLKMRVLDVTSEQGSFKIAWNCGARWETRRRRWRGES